jgi:hypothetical protein
MLACAVPYPGLSLVAASSFCQTSIGNTPRGIEDFWFDPIISVSLLRALSILNLATPWRLFSIFGWISGHCNTGRSVGGNTMTSGWVLQPAMAR